MALTKITKAVTEDSIANISASVAANAMTISITQTFLEFRSATLSDGTVNIRGVSAQSIVIPDTATLGTVSAVASRLILLAIDNAGTVELAVVNQSGGNDLSETGVISTTAIDATADSANVIYSTTARSNVAYKVLGYVESTQATAGTWASSPTTIQGAGGQALTAMNSLGYGQTYQLLTGSRSNGVTYYNTTGRPIVVQLSFSAGATVTCRVYVDGTSKFYSNALSNLPVTATVIVPPGSSYSTVGTSASTWNELR